ncbi:hypothetical protein [Streptomyces sp. LN549]|uniref:hypothetical protein n=1 Tax=Streptomyces sp. LN549 TaxID=3112979 RepID=UPI003715D659
MSEYKIRYMIIPPGVGPDDYEPGSLEQREHLVDVPGEQPTVATIHSTVQALLPAGSGVAILSVRAPGEN